MLQAAGGPGFAIEALQQSRILSDSSGDGFNGDKAADERIVSLEDNAHGSAADLLQDFVSANLLFFGLRHKGKDRLRVSLPAWGASSREARGEA